MWFKVVLGQENKAQISQDSKHVPVQILELLVMGSCIDSRKCLMEAKCRLGHIDLLANGGPENFAEEDQFCCSREQLCIYISVNIIPLQTSDQTGTF